MSIVADIIRRFCIRSMLVAVMALVVQANGAPAHAFGATDDCSHEAHLSQSMERGSDVTAVRQGGVFLVAKAPCKSAPCKSACCDVACSMAVLPSPATVDVPMPTLGTRPTSVFEGAEGIALDGPSRPPRASPSV